MQLSNKKLKKEEIMWISKATYFNIWLTVFTCKLKVSIFIASKQKWKLGMKTAVWRVQGAFIQSSWNLMHEYISRLSTIDFTENEVRTHLIIIFPTYFKQ